MPRKRRLRWLSDEDLVYVDLDIRAGFVVSCSIQYAARIGGRWHDVVRLDSAHGRLHLHRFWSASSTQVIDLETSRRDPRGYNPEVTIMLDDLETEWSRYRDLMAERLALDPFHRPIPNRETTDEGGCA